MKILILAALCAALLPSPVSALAVPEDMQTVIRITGWAPSEVPTFSEIIECESGWDRFAIGAQGELGLLQLLPSTFEDANTRLGSDIPISYWSAPPANLSQGRVIYLERGFELWSCYQPSKTMAR